MKITRNDSEQLVIADFPWLAGLVFAFGLIVSGACAIQGYFSHALNQKEWLGLGALALFCLIAGSLSVNRCVFIFDLAHRQLTWSRAGLFGRKGGLVPFDQLTGAVVEVMSDPSTKDRRLSHRLAVKTRTGEIPLTAGYYSGLKGKSFDEIRDTINRALGKSAISPERANDDEVHAMIADMQSDDAIKLVQERRGCSLLEARQIVADMEADMQPRN